MQVYGIGTDIVECLRIAQMIERHAAASEDLDVFRFLPDYS